MEEMMKDLTKLQVYLSNLAVWNAKLHNMHWNVVGKMFFQLHEKTEEMYDAVFAQFDDVAELIKIKGTFPVATLGEYVKHATIKEVPSKTFTTEEVISNLQADLTLLHALALEIRNDANDVDDFTIVAMFEGYVAEYEKNLWFIQSLNS